MLSFIGSVIVLVSTAAISFVIGVVMNEEANK